jgi:hypothetical protein
MPLIRKPEYRIWLLRILTITLVFASSNSCAGEDILSEAVISSGCSQEDIPALIIEVSPVLIIEIAGVDNAPFSLLLSPLRRDPTELPRPFARAQLRRSATDSVWLMGELKISRLIHGKEATGSYDFNTSDGRRIRGYFKAIWRRGGSRCG